MADPWSTHDLTFDSDTVIKRFKERAHGEPEAEWRTLTLLATYTPDIAPYPINADLAADPATVLMSRLSGTPLRGTQVTAEQIEMYATALTDVHTKIPTEVVSALPLRRGHAGELVARLRTWCRTPPPGPELVRVAFEEGCRGLDDLGDLVACHQTEHVLGLGDGNLANALWDGSRVRVLDFEESGRSDRAYELAEIAEHVSAWADTGFDRDAFLGHFTLTAAETARLRACRRLLALFWLIMLAHDADRAVPRNPPGTALRQAERLLGMVEERSNV